MITDLRQRAGDLATSDTARLCIDALRARDDADAGATALGISSESR
jgi:hypothetical protein